MSEVPPESTTTPPAGNTEAVATTTPPAGEPTRLPDDHPLVTAFTTVKSERDALKKEKQEAEDAKKTELEKQADANALLQKENAELKAEKLRDEVAKAKSDPAKGIVITPDLLVGSTKAELEAYADKLVGFKGGTTQLPGNVKAGGPVGDVKPTEETRDDRRKRLAEGLKR